jgi:hypothetical protein
MNHGGIVRASVVVRGDGVCMSVHRHAGRFPENCAPAGQRKRPVPRELDLERRGVVNGDLPIGELEIFAGSPERARPPASTRPA